MRIENTCVMEIVGKMHSKHTKSTVVSKNTSLNKCLPPQSDISVFLQR